MNKKDIERFRIINDLIFKKIDGTEAARLLNLSVRQTKRLKSNVKQFGVKGIIHGNRGKASHNKTNAETMEKAKKRLNEIYYDFNPLLAKEHLCNDNGIDLSKETVRQIMIEEGLWHNKKRKDLSKRHWRERKDNYGDMRQFDGSYHDWFESRNKKEIGSGAPSCVCGRCHGKDNQSCVWIQ